MIRLNKDLDGINRPDTCSAKELKRVLSISSPEPPVWFPLATEQLRLRSLTDVTLLTPASSSSFHLTLHESSTSDPFFISRQARVQHRRATWSDFDHSTQEFGGLRSVILRLWRDGECHLGLGLTFSGLVCVGQEATEQLMANCGENTLVFRLQEHLFVCNQWLEEPLDQTRYVEVPNVILDEVSSSYDITSLKKVLDALRALEEKNDLVLGVKKEISLKMEMRPKKKKSTLGKVLTDLTLHAKSKDRKNKPTAVQLRRKIENHKFKIDLLKEKKKILQNDVDYNKFRRDNNISIFEEINANVWMNEECLLSDKEEMEGWAEAIQETRDLYSWTQQRLSSQRKREDLERAQKTERGNNQYCCILSC